MKRHYLDHNATTPLDPRVFDAMRPWLGTPANASSTHAYGHAAREAVERARAEVAALVNARPDEVVFTSGGTEANNLALAGICGARRGALVVPETEHPSVLEPAARLERLDVEVRRVCVTKFGTADIDTFLRELPGAAIATMMWANNETGMLARVGAYAERCRELGVVLHTDAVQAVGKVPVDFAASGVHMMTLSAHKLYGPQGVGALVLDRSLTLDPPMVGGGQQWGLRGGTEPVAAIVGFGAACAFARAELQERARHLRDLQRRLETALASLPGVTVVCGDLNPEVRLPNTTLLTVDGIEGETLLLALDQAGFAVSSGSACASGRREPSHVLRAMGVRADAGVVRVSTGIGTDEAALDAFAEALRRLLGPGGGLAGGAVGGW